MAVNKRIFTANVKGGIATTGNTLGLWGLNDPPEPAAEAVTSKADGIGVFTTIDTSLRYEGYPPGTTTDWTKNSSSNDLMLPAGSTILSAWLFYSATQKNKAKIGPSDVSAYIYGSIGFTVPSGKKTNVAPLAVNVDSIIDVKTQIGSESLNTFYHASIDVTRLMEGSGSYTISGVPGCLGLREDERYETNHAGWTIVVAYENPNMPMRNLTIWDLFNLVRNNTTDILLEGFATPPLGYPLSGKLFLSAAGGDNYIDLDVVKFGPNASSLIPLSGPNNAVKNFFQSQINDDNGLLSTAGTFGTRNQPFVDSGEGTATEAARQGWDKTVVDISQYLTNDQTTAAIRLSSDLDIYLPQTAATQIELLNAVLSPQKSVTPTTATVGSTLTYTISFTNTGAEPAYNIKISDVLTSFATNISFIPGSLTVDGNPTTYDPNVGFTLPGPYTKGSTVTIEFKVLVNDMPVPNPFKNVASVTYSYISSAGGDEIIVEELTNHVTVTIITSTRGIEFI